MIFVPDESVLAYINYDCLKWQKLSWYDFQSKPTDLSKNKKTYINTFLKWKISKAYNYPPAIVVALMEPHKSWKGETYQYEKLALEHEQTHFDIVELYKRRVTDSISKSWGKTPGQIEDVISFFIDKIDYAQKEFDFVTYGGYDTLKMHQLDTITQHDWTSRINSELLR